jgi:hypothetical protein
MPTCREAIVRALRAVRAIAPGDAPHIDQLTTAQSALQDLVLELHEARGPLRDVDVPSPTPPTAWSGLGGAWTANQNTRVRIQAGFTVTVTLPNSVPMQPGFEPFDYGFVGWPAGQIQGSTGAADGVIWRAPDDGARIEIVGATHQLFFYRADINQWVSAYDLRLDDETPLNRRYLGPFATLLAERFSEDLALNEPSPGFARRVAQARAILFTRPGARAHPVEVEAF